MIFCPDGVKGDWFVEYQLEGKEEHEFLLYLLSGKNLKEPHSCCAQEGPCEYCRMSRCLHKSDIYRLVKKLRKISGYNKK